MIVQLSPGPRSPPVMVSRFVPLICEPTPQTSLAGRPTATRPVNTASRSSVKPRPLAGLLASILWMVKLSCAVRVAALGPSKALLKSTTRMCRLSLAGSPVTPSPPAVPVALLVVFR